MNGLLKLIAAGLICGGLLSMSAKGPQREILRFGCACLIMILLISVLRNLDLASFDLRLSQSELETTVEQTQAQNRTAILRETERTLKEEAERQAAILGLDCTAEVACAVDTAGVVTVTQVIYTYHGGQREALTLLKQTTTAVFGVPGEQIIIREGENT